jgi:hypothetical protein
MVYVGRNGSEELLALMENQGASLYDRNRIYIFITLERFCQ